MSILTGINFDTGRDTRGDYDNTLDWNNVTAHHKTYLASIPTLPKAKLLHNKGT